MKKTAEAIESAKSWRDLLTRQTKINHYIELGASSVIDLIDTLDGLIEACTKMPGKPKPGGGGSQQVRQMQAPKGDASDAVA